MGLRQGKGKAGREGKGKGHASDGVRRSGKAGDPMVIGDRVIDGDLKMLVGGVSGTGNGGAPRFEPTSYIYSRTPHFCLWLKAAVSPNKSIVTTAYKIPSNPADPIQSITMAKATPQRMSKYAETQA